MNRRQWFALAGCSLFTGAAAAGWKYWPDSGIKHPCLTGLPERVKEHPSWALVWRNIRPELVWDAHVHLVGVGDSGPETWFNPRMDRFYHPQLKVQKSFYMNATCAEKGHVDQSTVARLEALTEPLPQGMKLMLFAFDWYRDEKGRILQEQSIFHVSDQYAAKVAQHNPERFEWVASIHPYREDAVEALEHAVEHGAKAVKWLPSGMGIDPASPLCDAFYRKAAELGIPVISHTGKESAVAGGYQSYGNPLRMRRALEHGVKVILAHCASDGTDEDTDHGGRVVSSFELFSRMMDDSRYQGLLYGDISATTLINHAWVLPKLIARQDWHARLVHGSDYPLPGVMPLTNMNTMIAKGWLDARHKSFLLTLKQYNPLLYDFALKRLLVINGQSFSPQVFETQSVFRRV